MNLRAIKVWPITLTWQNLLGLRGRRDLNLRARPRIMCITGAGTTLTVLCRCLVIALSVASTASPPSLSSTALSYAPNELRGSCKSATSASSTVISSKQCQSLAVVLVPTIILLAGRLLSETSAT
ncbi:hypothetical protein PIB30_007411 [Stylosanthes scabra]|uniref:Uncharacterized protein n=1 Tax=Stylosanthes scabra TaxID=79078 RepID=A0ABU6Q4I8_9FABA|nr:hypothetical protein [Stylosanthes scabra]